MALNATKRKALRAALQANSRSKVTDAELEQYAEKLIEGKISLDDVSEKTGVSKPTLKKHFQRLASDPQPVAEA